jgi:hypothetical protein
MTDKPTQMRECVCCSTKLVAREKFDSKVPSIASLNVTIYRRNPKAPRGQQLATTLRVRVCEPCLGRILASRHGKLLEDPNAGSLAAALFDRISERYSKMLAEFAA